jgi:polyribonucleotide nucleotidyltransferase
MKKQTYSLEIGGKTLTAEFTDLAEQANGSVIVRYGNTAVLVTAVMSEKKQDGLDYFPLTVDYEERFYAAGAILGSRFVRREGRPTDEAILSGRIVDRTIRPLFDNHIRNEVQVVVTVLSIADDDPDVPAVIGASLALATSDIPWQGPVSAVRLGKKNSEANFEINPTYEFRNASDTLLDLLVCGQDGLINMIEVGSREVDEKTVMAALKEALVEIKKIEDWQKSIIAAIGKEKKVIEKPVPPAGMEKVFTDKIEKRMSDYVFRNEAGHGGINEIKKEWLAVFTESFPDAKVSLAEDYFEEKLSELVHNKAIDENRRPDGRGMDDIRPIFAKAGGISPILHGSGIFYRGGTHILSVLTLGGPGDSLILDGMEVQGKKRFIHHYNFPPFSTGETGRIGGMNRRMIGHGALAEKALLPVIPDKEIFPYTIRIVSEAFASNGSTSMGSVCGSTIALMDAGVPIKRPVAGIASGLMMRNEKDYKILTDIQGPEDHYGDMDFKVAGTKEGITAVQMDVKVRGVPLNLLEEAFEKARLARLKILEVIQKEIAAPRSEISPNAPKIISLKILPSQIGLIIGTGGKTINAIMEKTGAVIDIEDDGTVFLTGKNGAAEAAKAIIEEMTHEYKPGERFTGVVTRLMEFGAFVKIGANAEGLVHVSELAPWRVEQASDLVKEGDQVPVVVKDIDEKGRINLSIKAAAPNFFSESKPANQTNRSGAFSQKVANNRIHRRQNRRF